MKLTISSFASTMESFMKMVDAIVKLSIGLGGVCVILYSIRIEHFPRGLTLGDGLLFLLAVGCFGLLYLFFIVSLTCLGYLLSRLINQALKVCSCKRIKTYGRKSDSTWKLEPFYLILIPFAFMAVMIMIALSGRDYFAYLQLLSVVIMLYLLYSCAISASKKLHEAQIVQTSVFEAQDKKDQAVEEATHQKGIYCNMILLMLILPLFIGGVSGKLMDSAMRLANIRIEQPVVYIKAPYNELLPKSLISKNLNAPEGYKVYEGISVLFQGFGNTTVVAFKDEDTERQLEILNDQIIVEKKFKKRSSDIEKAKETFATQQESMNDPTGTVGTMAEAQSPQMPEGKERQVAAIAKELEEPWK